MRRVTLLTVPVLALALAGCGSSGPRPGTALELDGHRVSTRHVDDVASRYCRAIAQVGQTVTTQAVRTQVVSALALRLIGERFADAEGVSPDSSYDAAVAQLRSQLADFPPSTQDAIIEVDGAEDYANALAQSGGEQRFTDWLDDQHVTVNPLYGVTIDGGSFDQVDPSLSVAASRAAKTAAQDATNPSAAPGAGSRACG